MAEINVLVLDNGSDTIKAGYCIPERDPLLVRHARRCALSLCAVAPRAALSARCVARAPPERAARVRAACQVTPAAVRVASGDAAPSDGDGALLRPIRRGVVENWEALESIYHHVFYEQARARARGARRACRAAG
jgi:hypothetical protein